MVERSKKGRAGHPLPASDEARRDLVPEHLEKEKGLGDDPAARVTPPGDAVDPDGRPYPPAGNR